MASGMWTAAAGASAQAQNLDIVANNLANTDTPAFKKDLPTFKEYLATTERTRDAPDVPRGNIKDKDFYPLDGRDQSFVIMDGTHTHHQQGNLRVTQHQFDLALDGPGFLEISTPAGTRYTRQGSLKLAQDGRLVTTDGNPVLTSQPGGIASNLPPVPVPVNGQPRPNPAVPPGQPTFDNNAARYINLRDRGAHFSISGSGEIYAGDELIAKLSVVEFQDLKKIKKTGSGQIFENLDPRNRLDPTQTEVRQGVIETSNVNPIEEMTQMIKANRLFEQDLKALKTYGDLLGKEANEVGKL